MMDSQALASLDVQEFEIDLLDSGTVSVDAPLTSTLLTSTWICVTITIVSVSATAVAGCIEAG